MPTTDDLLDLRGVSQRSASFRFALLDQEDVEIGEIHPVRDSPPTVSHDTGRTIQRTLGPLALPPDEAAAVNEFRDRVKPYMVLQDGSQHPLGVFLWADPSRLRYSSGVPIEGTLVDKTLILDQEAALSVSYRVGVLASVAIRRTIEGLPFDAVIPGGGNLISDPLAWPAGTSRHKIVADLCTMSGFYPPYFDHEGYLRITAVVDPEEVPEADLVYEDGRNIYASAPVETTDALDAPNLYIVLGNGGNDLPVYGSYEIPAGAPNSRLNRGFEVTEVVQTQGLENNALAFGAAKALALTQSLSDFVSFQGPPDPRHVAFNVLDYRGERWLETAWSMPLLEGAPMSHVIRRSPR